MVHESKTAYEMKTNNVQKLDPNHGLTIFLRPGTLLPRPFQLLYTYIYTCMYVCMYNLCKQLATYYVHITHTYIIVIVEYT